MSDPDTYQAAMVRRFLRLTLLAEELRPGMPVLQQVKNLCSRARKLVADIEANPERQWDEDVTAFLKESLEWIKALEADPDFARSLAAELRKRKRQHRKRR